MILSSQRVTALFARRKMKQLHTPVLSAVKLLKPKLNIIGTQFVVQRTKEFQKSMHQLEIIHQRTMAETVLPGCASLK